MRDRLVQWLLRGYERAVRAGLLDRAWSRRAFEVVYLAYKQLLEAGPTSKLRELAPPGTAVIDVGANIGFFAIKFGRWVGPEGRVVAIEPESRNFESLRRRVERAGLRSVVECVQAVAAAEPGEQRLAVNPLHPGDHRIAADGDPVRAVTLDELTDGSGRRVSLLKLDVQGAETMALAGAERLLAVDRPAIFTEVDEGALRDLGSSAGELIGTILGRGYSAHTLTRSGISEPKGRDALLAEIAGSDYSDVLFLPPPD